MSNWDTYELNLRSMKLFRRALLPFSPPTDPDRHIAFINKPDFVVRFNRSNHHTLVIHIRKEVK